MNKRATAVLTLVVVAIVSAALCRGGQQRGTESQIQSLRKERRDTLRTVVEALTQRNAEGLLDIREVLDARHKLLKAEVDLATSHEERVRIYEKIVDNLTENESYLERGHKAGIALPEDALRAKARRLKAAIHLLEVKSSIR